MGTGEGGPVTGPKEEADSVGTEHEPSATRRHGQPELRLIDLTPGGNKESHN